MPLISITHKPKPETATCCPHCERTLDDQFETAFILIPRIDAVRYHTIVVQTIIARIESQATIYQPDIRRLCGEAEHYLHQNVVDLRSIIEQARHHRPLPNDYSSIPY